MLARNAWRSASSQTLTKFVRSAQTAAATSRRDEYAAISDRDINFFRDVLGDRGVVTDPEALQPLNKYEDNACRIAWRRLATVRLLCLQRLDGKVRR